MKLTDSLLSYLNRVFSKDPLPFLALRITCDSGHMTWDVTAGILTLTPAGITIALPLSIDLSTITIAGLANYLSSRPGYIVPFVADFTVNNLSALVILEGSGDVSQSNGDHLYGYSNILYAYVNATANELELAQDQIPNAVAQMSTTSAGTEFLDFLGTYYKVPRNPGELDQAYAPRIISSVLLPSANNVGMAIALQSRFPGTAALVQDAVTNAGSLVIRDGSIKFNSLFVHNSGVLGISNGLFDIVFIFSFGGAISPAAYVPLLIAAMNAYRAGGTYLRNLILKDGASASIIINSFNVGPILVIEYGQNQTLEDSSSSSWTDDVEDDEEFDMEPFKSIAIQGDAVPRAIEDVFDWSDETVDQDELIVEYMAAPLSASATQQLMVDGTDWTEEEPEGQDDREVHADSRPVGANATVNPVEDATDWSEEDPDEGDLDHYNTSKVTTGAAQNQLMDDGFDLFSDDGDEFYANHFTNTEGAGLAAPDQWPWMDEDEEMVLIVVSYLNSDAPPGAPLLTEGNISLATEGGVTITTET